MWPHGHNCSYHISTLNKMQSSERMRKKAMDEVRTEQKSEHDFTKLFECNRNFFDKLSYLVHARSLISALLLLFTFIKLCIHSCLADCLLLILGHKSTKKFKSIHNAWHSEIPLTSNSSQCSCSALYCW